MSTSSTRTLTRTLARISALLLAAAAAGALSGCAAGSSGSAPGTSSPTATTTAHGQAGAVTVADPWAKAADSGMTAAFATLTNTSSSAVTLVSATSPASAHVQLHETVTDSSGATSMRERANGLAIPAGASTTLTPGGDHLMFIDLNAPLKSGTTTSLTLTFADGSTLAVTAEVRTFGAAKESYLPSATSTPTGGMSSASHD
ncbi:MAG: copper chaperone PCu(A)C [Dermatophilaceae bacterium]